MLQISPLRGFFLFSATLAAASTASAVSLTGVNLASAEFGEQNLPGTYVQDYVYPRGSEVDYFLAEGMDSFRLPFRWERLQPNELLPFNTNEQRRLDKFVNETTAKGATVIIDPHNFARYYPDPDNFQQSDKGLIGSNVPDAAFADFWGRLAERYGDNDRVIFGLMNEPNSVDTDQWVRSANAAIAAIRETGAKNLVLVPGTRYSGAHSWNRSDAEGRSNADAMLDITDPAGNVAFEVHQYLDGNFSGGSSDVQSETIGVDSLREVTDWLIANDKQAYLGEFAAGASSVGDRDDQIGDEAITLMLEHLEENSENWLGWAWWAAGPYWGDSDGDYRFDLNLNDKAAGTEAVQLDLLRPFLNGTPVPEPAAVAVLGFGGALLLRRRRNG